MLRPELESVFLAIADADEAAGAHGSRVMFRVTRLNSPQGTLLHHRRLERNTRVSLPDLEEMKDEGLIKLSIQRSKNEATFRVTPKGMKYAQEVRGRSITPAASVEGTSELDWTNEVRPVLGAAYAAYCESPARGYVTQPDVNVRLGRPEDDPRTDRVLGYLTEDKYIEGTASAWQAAGPVRFKLTPKGLQQVAGWPGDSADLGAALIEAVEEMIQSAPEGDERDRLERFRDAATSVGVNTVSSVIAKLITNPPM